MDFNEHALPLMIAIVEFEPEGQWDDFKVFQFLQDRGLSKRQQDQVLDRLLEDGLIKTSIGTIPRTGYDGIQMFPDPEVTAEGLKQLNLWPAENERELWLTRKLLENSDYTRAALDKIVESLEAAADDPNLSADEQSKIKAVLSGMRDLGVGVLASLIANAV